ncbi:Serine protease 30 [Trichinella pseudospiralis]|uniref:Serine protease 30 n=2 Tax=Trichinella pseudospiralis TaxID=6337 RepID=A0A0V1K741_TRIPS|nr:Serine protease 30 [Trichinella pseudospiralis]
MKRWYHFVIFFYYALLMFCIIIKPYFEPYLTNPQNPNRIVGGWVAKPYSFPWTVHILTHTSGFWYESCGGSLISLYSRNASDTILTASHCVRVNNRLVDPNAITVTAGVFNIKKLEEPHRVISKVLAYISDNFDDISKANDIAILRLKVGIPHSEYISPVCLPYQNQELPWGETCFVSGWGLTRESGKPSPKLRQVGIPILRNNNCPFIDVEDMFCAGEMSGGKDSCQGDSGGPLVCKLNDTFFQMGIVSFGDGCARKNHPGIYTKVPHYVKWIYDEAAKLPDSSTSSEIEDEEPDYSNDFHHPWGSVGNHFYFPFFDSSDDMSNNENFENEYSSFSQLLWSFLNKPMPLFRSRSSFINKDSGWLESNEEKAGDWSPYSTNGHSQTNYDPLQTGEESQPPYPPENWPDIYEKYPAHHHSQFRPPLSYPNGPSMNEEHLSQPPNFENPENQSPYTSENRPKRNGHHYSDFHQPYLQPNGPSINKDRPSPSSDFENLGNRPPYSLSNRPTMNEHRPPPPLDFPNSENQMPNSFENGPPMDQNHYNPPFVDNSEYQPSLSFPKARSVNHYRPPPPNDRYSDFSKNKHLIRFCLLFICIKTFSEECGKPYFEPYLTNPKNSNEMDGEWVAKPYSFPWTVHIFAHVSGLWYESCVGSLISLYPKNTSDTILTASRCVRVNKRFVDPNAITVTAGVFNIKKLEEPHRVTSKVLAYISNNFGDVSKPNDIALLRLKVEIPHSKYISPVCLPYQNQELPWGETCFVSGWGLTRGRPSSKMRQVGIPILRKNDCRFLDAYDMFCAGDKNGGKDSCRIDSGGPLVCKLNDTFFQLGIVSFRDDCARKNHAGIYTKVPYYVSWMYYEGSMLPDSFNSSEVGGEDTDCLDDFHSPWALVGNDFHHPWASVDMESLGDAEDEAGDWSPYSTNRHSRTNYERLQIGEEDAAFIIQVFPLQSSGMVQVAQVINLTLDPSGNRPPYSLSNRPTMNEHRPPPPLDFPNSENQMPNSFENGPPMDQNHYNPPFVDNSEYQPSLSFPKARSVNHYRPPPPNDRYSGAVY